MTTMISVARPVWLGAALCVLSCAPIVSQAQVRPFELQPVTVTGSGTPRTLGSEIAATSVLTRGDIERSGARDAVQVLNLLGTALVEQQGGAGTLAAVRIRGADSRDTLVLVDGVPLTDVTSGQALIQQIPADIIERVEVVRGNLSALYGANATGGVIQIFTRRGVVGGFAPQISVGAGDRGTRSLSASAGAGSEKLSARVSVGTERTDGFSAGNTANSNPDPDGNERRHATLSFDASPAEGHRLGFDLRVVDATAMYDAPRFGEATDTHEQQMIQSGLTARGTHALSRNWSLVWRVGESKEKRTDTEVSRYGAVRPNTLRNSVAALELGGALTKGLSVKAAAERLRQSTTSISHTQRSRDTDVLRAGASYDADWGSLQANLRHDETSDFGSASTGLVGGSLKLGRGLSAVGSVSTSFTPPTLDFLFYDCGPTFPCSNPDLRPERARNMEAGLQWLDGSTLLRATLFSVRYRDKIANDANFVPQNTPGRVKNNGLELSLRQALGDWTVLGEATFQDPKDEATGSRPIRRTRQQFAVRADYQRPGWTAGAGVRRVGNRLDIGPQTLPAYTVVDASAHWTMTPDWTWSARIDNLFDRRYEPTAGYNGRPRGVFVGVSWAPRN
jgi:vitamin B12 transporter